MAIQTIVQLGHPALRTVCDEVPVSEISSPETQGLIQDLRETLANEHDGVGISAPQIAVNRRVFILSRLAFSDHESNSDRTDLVCINPVITKTSSKMVWGEEGCLSIRWDYGDVERYDKVTLEAYDEHGQKYTRGAGGFLARVIQHELDHLDGILFIDKAKNIRSLPPEEAEKIQTEDSENEIGM